MVMIVSAFLVVLGVFAVSLGLTWRKLGQERRARLDAEARSVHASRLLAGIGEGLLLLDRNAGLVFSNDEGARILSSASQRLQEQLRSAARESVKGSLEHFHQGLNRWFEFEFFPYQEGGIAVLARDITASRRLSDALYASEERFRKLLESRVVGVFMADDECITEANEAFLTMIGYTRDDLAMRRLRWMEVYGRFEPRKIVGELFAPEASEPSEIELVRKNGRRIPVLFGAALVNESPVETIGLVVDLTDRKVAYHRLQSIVEASRILGSSLDYEKTFSELVRFIAGNLCEHCAVFAQEEDQLRCVAVAYSEAQGNRVEDAAPGELMEKVIRTGRSEYLLRPSGSRACAVVPIPARSKIAGVFVLMAGDRTNLEGNDMHLFEEIGRRAGLALEHARLYSSAQEANRLKDEFVAIVSHELRTPLTPILGAVYMLRTEPSDTRILKRALDLIERNAKAQSKIVEDLLDVSRIISGKLRLNLETVDLPSVIQAAVETVRPAGDAKNISIEVTLRPLNGVIYGDADRLQQVIWNLLANSVKFTPNGGRISVELAENRMHAELRVHDTGIGIGA